MATNLNNCTVAGRLTADPVETEFSVKFTIAVNRGKDKNGNDLPAYFLPVQINKKRWFENQRKNVKKGVGIVVQGRAENRASKDSEGKTRNYFFINPDVLYLTETQVNTVVINGNLCAKPEVHKTGNGNVVANLRVACNYTYKNDKDEFVDQPSFLDVTVWGKTAEFAEKYFDKGSAITVEGELTSREYQTKEGDKRTAYGVNGQKISFGGSRKKNDEAPAAKTANAPAKTVEAEDFEINDDYYVVNDDEDLPF